jgi:two-component system, NarL family, sensor kinase
MFSKDRCRILNETCIFHSMNPKSPFFIVLFLISLTPLFAQNVVDSLETRLKEKLSTTEEVSILSELCWQYRQLNQNKALAYGKKAVSLATTNGDKTALSKALNDLSIIYIDKTELDTAILLLNNALAIRKELRDTLGQAAIYNKLGIIYQNRQDLRSALDNALRALELFEQLKMQAHVRTTLNNIGIIHYNLHNYDKSLEIHTNLLKLRKDAGDKYGLGQTLVNLGNVYGARGDTTTAIAYYEDAANTFRSLDRQEELAVALNNFAAYCNALGRYADAQKAVSESLSIRRTLNNPKEICSALIMLGELKSKTNENTAAIKHLNEAISISKRYSLPQERSCYQKLAAVYRNLHNADSVFRYYQLYESMNTLLYEENLKNEVAELQTKYETEKKEQAIQSLSNANMIQQLQLSRERTYFLGGGAIIILLALFGWQFQRSRRLSEKIQHEENLKKEQERAARAIIESELNERRRIAAELHDGVIQTFVTARLNLSTEAMQEKKSDRYQSVLQLIDEGCSELRTISHTMMPESLMKKGLAAALHDLASRIDDSVLDIRLNISGMDKRLDTAIEASIYRIVQECLSNTLKHAKATRLDIQLVVEEQKVDLMIEDNGVGFDSAAKSYSGIGLQNIRSRVNLLSGELELSSAPGQGTLISIMLPSRAMFN